jgi:hypothetical protein
MTEYEIQVSFYRRQHLTLPLLWTRYLVKKYRVLLLSVTPEFHNTSENKLTWKKHHDSSQWFIAYEQLKTCVTMETWKQNMVFVPWNEMTMVSVMKTTSEKVGEPVTL